MSNLLQRRSARQESMQAEEQNANSALTMEYNRLWGGSGKRIELLDPEEIELFKDAKGNAQPDRLQENKVLKIMASAEDVGILQASVVRVLPDGTKQMLAGRHRREAAIRLNLKLPCEVLHDIDDVTAYKIMAETNTHGEEQFPSEQGMIYSAYLEMRTSGGEEKTVKEIAAKFGVSEKTIYRYIRILDLPGKLQEAIDYKIIPIGKLEELFKLTPEQQEILGEYIDYYGIKHLSAGNIRRLLLVSDRDDWDMDFVWQVLNAPQTLQQPIVVTSWNSEKQPSSEEEITSSNVAHDPVSETSEQAKNLERPLQTSVEEAIIPRSEQHERIECTDSLIEKIRANYNETLNMSDEEISELVLNLLADVFNRVCHA